MLSLLYWNHGERNLGDLLNENICQELFSLKIAPPPAITYKNLLNFEASFIGSTLGLLIMPKQLESNMQWQMRVRAAAPIKIWGSGFLMNPLWEENQLTRKIEVYALRGKKTKERLENITKVNFKNIPLADPGILASKLIKKQQKKYDFGIIPHHSEVHLPIFKQLTQVLNNAIFIDVHGDVLESLQKIAQCKIILSSALHGLIIADSFGIPNARILATNTMRVEQNYKFIDYYSAYDLEGHLQFDLNQVNFNTLDSTYLQKEIQKNYPISRTMIKEKQKQLLECFPY
ncbi:polysaccharide pyruvyl transferase family protein [Helicobacter sp. MIT 11-5569]|uniref:polysaccharide pyruvyl transferase family protein n=1 Tax=Helicobacter sp. MIT 11-5569 TaxID=1548151 RepID=UPI0010FED960|nr:polysaccharide pyruvyl transferase family protein [Helicobacter sp. MIT 11-5569]TLD85153.1 polysaccharide pyruvyl transferase family protein [Helicobacter sp. MIT 11-5569]